MFLFLTVAASSSMAFPSWMGVYGPYVRHDGGNPGTFTILMNQDYWGLQAEVGLQVNGGGWTTHAMSYSGNVQGNSRWTVTLSQAFPQNAAVAFYFHGWDLWGGNIWDSNWGNNYSFTAGPTEVYWIGNTAHWPTNGAITPASNLYVNLQSWPKSGAAAGGLVYTSTRGLIWNWQPLVWGGVQGNNDAWSANLGTFDWNKEIQFAAYVTDGSGYNHWDNNSGYDYRARVNRDPSLAPAGDFDGDGIPNGLEYDLQFDPTDPRDGLRDDDDDGIPNGEEFGLGTQMFLSDTDEDGVPDFLEQHGLLTSPTATNSHVFQTALSLNVTATSSVVGAWSVAGSTIKAGGPRGRLAYNVTLPASDIYRVLITVKGVDALAALRPSIDGFPLRGDEQFSPASNTTETALAFFTPFLPSGAHSLSIEWDNTYKRNELVVQSIVFQRIPGPETNGMKDWVRRVVEARNTFRLAPSSSVTSPAFVEGNAWWADAVAASGGVVLHPTAHGWYADVPIQAAVPTQVTFASENGAIQDTLSIEWAPLNVLTAPAEMTLRVGDRVKLMADDLSGAEGTSTIWVGTPTGQVTYVTDQYLYEIHEFTEPGTYEVEAELVYGTNQFWGAVTLYVVDAQFPTSTPVCRLGRARAWECPGLGEGVTVVADPHLFLEGAEPLAGGGYRFNLATDRYRERYVEARADGENGPIVAVSPVKGVQGFGSNDTWLFVDETLPDGTQVFQVGIIMAPLDPQVGLTVKTLGGGVTFESGLTQETYTAADFDETGVVRARIVVPPGSETAPCHAIDAYDLDYGLLIGGE